MTIRSTSSVRRYLPLLLILWGAFFSRVWGIAYGLPFVEYFTSDGERFVADAVRIAGTKNWNPGWFGHPGSTIIYSLAIGFGLTDRLDHLVGASELFVVDQFAQNPSPFYFMGRVFATFCALVSISVISRIGSHLGDRQTGIIAASLLAVSPLHVFISWLARTDAPTMMFALLSIWGAIQVLESTRYQNYLLAGIAAGLAMSTKYYGLVALVALPVAHLLSRSMIKIPNGNRQCALSQDRTHWGKLILGLGCAPFAFVLTSPFAILDWRTTLNNLIREGHNIHPGADGFSLFENLWWYSSWALPSALGWVAVFFAIIGLGWAIYNRRRLTLIVLSFILCFMALISYHSLHWDRWIAPVLPLFALFAALGLRQAILWLTRLPGKTWTRRLLTGLLIVTLMVQPVMSTIVENINRSLVDTRLLARAWVQSHLSPGSHIALEAYTSPLDADKFVLTKTFALSDQPVTQYCRTGIEYLIVSSEIQKRYDADPPRYQANIQFYSQLRDNASLLYQIAPIRWQITGPTVKVYSLQECQNWVP